MFYYRFWIAVKLFLLAGIVLCVPVNTVLLFQYDPYSMAIPYILLAPIAVVFLFQQKKASHPCRAAFKRVGNVLCVLCGIYYLVVLFASYFVVSFPESQRFSHFFNESMILPSLKLIHTANLCFAFILAAIWAGLIVTHMHGIHRLWISCLIAGIQISTAVMDLMLTGLTDLSIMASAYLAVLEPMGIALVVALFVWLGTFVLKKILHGRSLPWNQLNK